MDSLLTEMDVNRVLPWQPFGKCFPSFVFDGDIFHVYSIEQQKFTYTQTSDENKVIRIAKCDVFSGVCESIR